MIFSEYIKKLMEDNNLNKKQFAENIGVSPRTVENWFYGRDPKGVTGLINLIEKTAKKRNKVLTVSAR